MIKQKIFFILFLTFICPVLWAQNSKNQFDNSGKRHGYWSKPFPKTEMPRYEGQFDHGKEIGVFKYYKLVNGKSVLSATKSFNANNALSDVKFFSSTGKLISEGRMNGKVYIGKWIFYQNKTDGKLSEEYYNDEGKLEGERTVYYPNKKVAEVVNYKNGIRQGKSSIYAENGVLIKVYYFENDELNGAAKYYDSNSNLVAEGSYKKDKKVGVWKYYEKGKLVKTKDFSAKKKRKN
ncbi:MAG: hypothetical protein BM564_00165 [Bacteroidetes bacterium MedPE-SWsnd-G2]|mgnify:CR=1 FL=1|nr:MAG: hypothetical protein BM564_00165 [Bacteroidetes bacterium MedPE-SWsnd-G2]